MNGIFTANNQSYVNRAAFMASTTLSVATIGFTLACVVATSTVTAVAMGIFAVAALSASMGSIWAWCFKEPKNISEYCTKTLDITAFAFVGTAQFIAQNVIHAALDGLCRAISDRFYKKLA